MIEKETAIQGYFFFWSSSSLSLRKENFPENYNYNMVFIGGGGGVALESLPLCLAGRNSCSFS